MTITKYDRMMSKLQRQTLALLERPPEERNPEDIAIVLPWIRNKAPIFRELDTECLNTVIKNTECETVSRDNVIIEQGDPGACFYITLVGSVSIYVNPQKEEDSENLQATTGANSMHNSGRKKSTVKTQPVVKEEDKHIPDQKNENEEATDQNQTEQTMPQKSPTKLDRSKYGTFVIKLGEGYGFGEAALIRNCTRTATVIANDEASLMVIKKELFAKTLKNYHENDYANRRAVIDNNILFKGWKKKHKLRLELSLQRKKFAFDSVIIRQGEQWKGLVFIADGQAKLDIEPNKHSTQYEALLPFCDEIDVYRLELNRPSKTTPKTGPEEEKTSARAEKEQVYIRRKEGYAAAEKRVQNRVVSLCTVERGDILGDIEVMSDLKTYCSTATATTNMEVYFLSPNNFKRLLSRTSPETQTYGTLQVRVKAKLTSRIYSKQGGQIPLFKHLLNHLATQNVNPYSRPVVEPKASVPLPDSGTMFEHLMSNYLEDKAQLVTPRVQGGVYYKDLARIKMKQRELHHHKDLETIKCVKKNRKIKVKRSNSSAPRTSTALKKAICQARDQQLSEARHKMIEEARIKEFEEVQAVKTRLQRSVTETVLQRQSNLIIKDITSREGGKPGTVDTALKKKESMQDAAVQDQTTTGKNSQSHNIFITSLGKTKNEPSTTTYNTGFVESEKPVTDNKELSLPDIKSHSHKINNLSQRRATLTHSTSVQQFPNINLPSQDFHVDQPRKVKPWQLSKSGSKSYECLLDPSYEKDAPHLGSKELTSFSDFDALRDSLEPVICENPSYRDWETNDTSLTYLEEKVKDFILRQDMTAKKETLSSLPKLQRYECKDTAEQPIQGGKVLVKSSSCPVAANSQAIKRYHEHTRCNLLPSIPEYWSLRKQRMVRQAIKDEDRSSWLQKHQTNLKDESHHTTTVTH